MGEETKTAGKKKDSRAAAAAPGAGPQPIVLKVDLHCLGCTRKVSKAIKHAPGVVSVAADVPAGKLVVTGMADAAELKQRIEARTKKAVQIIAAGPGLPKKEKNAGKDKGGCGGDKKAADKEVTLQVQVHCETCIGGRIKRRTSKMKAVMGVAIDADKDTVKVTGTMDAAALPDYLRDKLGQPGRKDGDKKDKGAGDVGDKNKDRGGEENKDRGGDEKKSKPATAFASVSPTPVGDAGIYQLMPPQYGYTPFPSTPGGPPPNPAFYDNAGYPSPYLPYAAHLHAPLMFSDENPDSCTVM